MNSTAANVAPTTAGERILVLDSLRGFALWGVFIINSLIIARPPDGDVTDYPVVSALDHIASWVVQALVSGKFYTLFAFLFGVSFTMLLARLDERTKDGAAIMRRRLLVLLGIGLVHSVLIWNGDILKWYAICGLGLLLIRRMAPAKRLRLALVLLSLFFLVYAAIAIGIAITQEAQVVRDASSKVASLVFADGGFLDVTAKRMRILVSTHQMIGLLGVALYIFPMFLLGSWFGDSQLYLPSTQRTKQFRRLLRSSAVLGVGACCGFLWFGLARGGLYGTADGAAKAICFQASNLGLGLLMACLFVNHPAKNPPSRFFVALAPMGRMALTNYLTHSLMLTWLMYDYGLGLVNRSPGIVNLLAGTCVLYLVLMGTSRAWLRQYRFGPVEWVWRSLTYGRMQPMRQVGVVRGP